MKIKKMGKFLSFILGPHVVGITLAPFGVYIREDYMNSTSTVNHEAIHWKQQMEMLVIPFYLWYLVEWGLKILIHGGMAYYYLSFEREAYTHQDDMEYIKNRKRFAWVKLLCVKS
jgi:hypothetical protein